MKTKFIQILSLLLAALLQMAPLLRSFVAHTQGLSPNAWAFILKISVGAAALAGFDSVSKASSIAVSPPTATLGTPYNGTVTYSGGHAAQVGSMMASNAANPTFTCLLSPSSFTLAPGLTMTYPGSGNVVNISGTPSGLLPSTNTFGIKCYDGAGCPGTGSSDSKQKSTLIVVGASGGPVAPSMAVLPESGIAQVGSDVILSGGAIGTPTPGYYWKQGINTIGSGNTLTISAVQLTNSGIYTLYATNSVGLASAACYLTIIQTPGSNILALNYTNYYPASNSLTMYTLMTNVPAATNTYQWKYNANASGLPTTSNLTITANALTPLKSGTYSMVFSSIVPTNSLIGTNNTLVNQQLYDSYWAFGYVPGISTSPASVTTNAGANVTLSVTNTGNLDTVRWYKNTTNLVSTQSQSWNPLTSNLATNSSLVLSNVAAGDAGSYTVVITNSWGSITSSPAVLTVNSGGFAPVITVNPPTALSLLAGQNAAISVTVTGTPPFSFQWRRGGTNLVNGGVYGGTATNTLSLTGVATGNSGNYTVAITNTTGSVTSSIAAVNIALPPTVTAALGFPNLIQLGGSTLTGLTYVVQSATNLAAPDWVPLQTNNSGVSGAINFQINTTGSPSIFYRLLFP